MCGYHAANAIKDELMGINGFEKYTNWWNKSFDFNHTDPFEFVNLYSSLAMKPKYSDEELDYMFSLLEGTPIAGTLVNSRFLKIYGKQFYHIKIKFKIN